MTKILVADDNSNVQRTVTQGLASLGIEVVAVNNGEAAVRKLRDTSFDLVLADIFMPVRNGYEVCEYIKKDARFARIPVVLLVGAFDPFDEREAQRVGADGILKKPFVPPDPMIDMVKTLLERVHDEHLVGATVSSTVGGTKQQSGAPIPSASTVASAPVFSVPEESSPEEVAPAILPVSFGEGDRPVAFGSLFGVPVAESDNATGVVEPPVDDEQVLTSHRDSTLGEPVFWRNDSSETAPEIDQTHDDLTADTVSAVQLEVEPQSEPPKNPPAGLGETSLENETGALLDAANTEAPSALTPLEHLQVEPLQVEPLQIVLEQVDAGSPSTVDTQPIVLDPAQYTTRTAEAAIPKELASNLTEWMASAPAVQHEPAPVEAAPAEIAEEVVATPEAVSANDAVDEKTERIDEPSLLVTGWQSPSPEPESNPAQAAVPPAAVVDHQDASGVNSVNMPGVPTTIAEPDGATSPADTERSIRKNYWADLTGSMQSEGKDAEKQNQSEAVSPMPAPTGAVLDALTSSSPNTSDPAPEATTAGSHEHAALEPDPALVEAVVLRVLDKMRPQVVDIITREFLRPVVQALVHREIEKQ